jgi:hypothetical protein
VNPLIGPVAGNAVALNATDAGVALNAPELTDKLGIPAWSWATIK